MENDKKNYRKTLGMKCTQEFYDTVCDFVQERGMTVSSLIRIALKETYGLEDAAMEQRRSKELPK